MKGQYKGIEINKNKECKINKILRFVNKSKKEWKSYLYSAFHMTSDTERFTDKGRGFHSTQSYVWSHSFPWGRLRQGGCPHLHQRPLKLPPRLC